MLGGMAALAAERAKPTIGEKGPWLGCSVSLACPQLGANVSVWQQTGGGKGGYDANKQASLG